MLGLGEPGGVEQMEAHEPSNAQPNMQDSFYKDTEI